MLMISNGLTLRMIAACAVVSGCHRSPTMVSKYGSLVSADGVTPRRGPHSGVDIALDLGQEVISAADGLIVTISSDGFDGTTIEIQHAYPPDAASRGAPYHTAYTHLARAKVVVGDRVLRGSPIGVVGLFPGSAGVVHVHWELCSGLCNSSTTMDPLERTRGCYITSHEYRTDRLELTLPVRC